jgi:hypothetical protein
MSTLPGMLSVYLIFQRLLENFKAIEILLEVMCNKFLRYIYIRGLDRLADYGTYFSDL